MKQVAIFICALSVLFQLYSMAHAAPADLFGTFTNGLTSGASNLMNPASFMTAATDIGKNAASAITGGSSSLPNPANMISTAISSGTNVASELQKVASTATDTAKNAMSSGVSSATGALTNMMPSSNGAEIMHGIFNGLSAGGNIFGSIMGIMGKSASSNNGGSFIERMTALFDNAKTDTSSIGALLTG